MDQIFTLSKIRHIQYWLLTASVLTMLTVFLLQSRYRNVSYGDKDLDQFESTLHEKEDLLEGKLSELAQLFHEADRQEILSKESVNLQDLADEGIYIYYFDRGLLSYWNDNSVWMRPRWRASLSNPLYVNDIGLFVTKNLDIPEGKLYGLIQIKNTYPYENAYLQDAYQKDFSLRSEIELRRQAGPGLSDVISKRGNYLFSLNLGSHLKNEGRNITFATIFFFISLLLFFGFLSIQIDLVGTQRQRSWWLSISVLSLSVLIILIMLAEIPAIVFQSELFSPDVFASISFPSLGHAVLIVFVILMLGLLFYLFFNRSKIIPARYRRFITILLGLLASMSFIFAHHLGESFVMDSTLSLQAYKLNTLSIYSVISLITLVLAYCVYGLLFDKALQLSKMPLYSKSMLVLLLVSLLPQILFLIAGHWKTDYYTPLAFLLLSGSLVFLRSAKAQIAFSRYFPLLIVFSIYLSADLQRHISDKNSAQVEIELAKLSSEHDVVAELLFQDISDQISGDSLLVRRLAYDFVDSDRTTDYLQRTYFSGYWTKYDLQPITVCRPSDSLLLDINEDFWVPCYPFFDEILDAEGLKVANSDFYFLPNLNGRISYMGVHRFKVAGNEVTLYTELNSKIVSEELGYPSLLLRNQQERRLDFSYAKYHNGIHVTSDGFYNYRRESTIYTDGEEQYENLRLEGYNHTIYNVNDENTVIVSIPVVSFTDKVISFSYMFAILIAAFFFSYIIVNLNHISTTVTWGFKNKIQYSMLGILFLTFIVICAGTIFFVIQQYQVKHRDNMDNTMRSLYIELMHKVEYEEDLRNWYSDKYYNLDELLRKFSNVFYTDINMYDKYGSLLATSRQELFDQHLLSNRMNRQAFEKLSEEKFSEFIQTEQIGEMSFESSYVPLLNNENRFLAYLNLPYFSQPEGLTQEVTNLVVAILNLYVILLLFILFLSVFLADRITQPLRFIQDRIAHLSLNKTNEKIVYKGKDEIAGLVDEYNYMVDELVKSAELLASSERETAWREMAKQIAHEIKNPLTPMKLNIQHMLRILEEGKGDLEEQVSKVSLNLIEQIDLLSSIASEFSDFAKIPKAKSTKIDIVKKLNNVAALFENSKGAHIDLNLSKIQQLYAFGDAEQFQRVIINLVKNGIQAIPEGREKKISIALSLEGEDHALVTVSDNGKGIPNDIRDKLFHPNFTTKSSGMGMGLAISASIIKGMDGQIWYQTRENEGTSFFIKVPLYKDLSSF